MKKITIAFALFLISTTAISQNKTDSAVKKPTFMDTLNAPIFSANNIRYFYDSVLSKYPHDQFVKINSDAALSYNALITWGIGELRKPKISQTTGTSKK